ncbi:membrane protein insertion efficiency factor YidD [Psychroserpens mesophilus]|uniref:membrane protein insertion efficiency factor YidD n=1 Tax=Psychroserpens mesophilus TaxID=325473 RepID=UPI000694A35B
MKYILLVIIKSYWHLIPAKKRTLCIYKESCSHYVFDKTKTEGFSSGLRALWFRYQNCRPGYYLMTINN